MATSILGLAELGRLVAGAPAPIATLPIDLPAPLAGGSSRTASWARIVEPTVEPISLEEAKAQARIVGTASDALLAAYIAAARDAAEQYLGRGLCPQTWRLYCPAWADRIALPMAAPLRSVERVWYFDAEGIPRPLEASTYGVDGASRPGAIVRAPGASWPATQADRGTAPIAIDYIVGWPTPADIPPAIRQGIALYVTYLDLDRDGLEPNAAQARKAAEACWLDAVSWLEPEEWRS